MHCKLETPIGLLYVNAVQFSDHQKEKRKPKHYTIKQTLTHRELNVEDVDCEVGYDFKFFYRFELTLMMYSPEPETAPRLSIFKQKVTFIPGKPPQVALK